MALFLVGLNHTTAPVALRETLYFSKTRLPQVLQEIIDLPGVEEAVALSTCNRTEIYIEGHDSVDLIDFLAERACLHVPELVTHLYRLHDNAAAAHLFRVACGLDSLVVGETQILGQIAEAAQIAQQTGTAGRHLSTLFQHAQATGKRARAETAISEGAFSVGRIAVELASQLFPDITHRPTLVLGAGKMAELTAKHLASHGAWPILVANRTYTNAVELADQLGGQAIHYEGLERALSEVDIVISSTSAPHLVLHADLIAQVMERREGRPLFLIDIAIPRDIDPAAAGLEGVHLYNVDDLQEVADQYHRQRMAEVANVEQIVAEELLRWQARRAGLHAAPVISALRDSFEQIRQAELSRAGSVLATLTPEQRDAVDRLTAALINKILHTPTVRLKDAIACQRLEYPDRLLCELFALQETEDEQAVPVQAGK